MPRTPGVFTDCPPGPRPVPVEPPADLKLAQRLVADAEAKAVASYKSLVASYYRGVLKMAAGEQLTGDETSTFQRAIHLLRKSQAHIAADLGEARKILAAQKWLSNYDPKRNQTELNTAATKIAGFDAELQREIARIRSAAAPFHKRVEELQRVEFSVTGNTYQAKTWDRWLSGNFQPDGELLDRVRNSL